MKIKILDNDKLNKLNKNEVYDVEPFWLDENTTLLALQIIKESKEEIK